MAWLSALRNPATLFRLLSNSSGMEKVALLFGAGGLVPYVVAPMHTAYCAGHPAVYGSQKDSTHSSFIVPDYCEARTCPGGLPAAVREVAALEGLTRHWRALTRFSGFVASILGSGVQSRLRARLGLKGTFASSFSLVPSTRLRQFPSMRKYSLLLKIEGRRA